MRRIKWIISTIVIILLTAASLIGCSSSLHVQETEPTVVEKEESKEEIPETQIQEIEVIEPHEEETTAESEYVAIETEAVIEENVSDDLEENRAKAGITEASIDALIASESGKFYMDACQSDEERILYVEILQILNTYTKDIKITTMNAELIDRIYQFVMDDHPEIFYSNGYTYTRHTVNGELKYLSFSGNYIYDANEIVRRQQEIEYYTANFLTGITESTEYGKVKYVYEYLINNTQYNLNAADNQNICSVFLYRQSVCQGYAKAAQYLLNRIGVYATLVVGYANGENHAWNLVRVDGNYYYVDPTWGDASYQPVAGESANSGISVPEISYDYLCVPSSWLFRTHSLNQLVQMPDCNSIDANYYVREGRYLTWYDENVIRNNFQNAYANGNSYLTFKCADQETYNEVYSGMISNQGIFSFLNSSTQSVNYALNEDELTLSFWL